MFKDIVIWALFDSGNGSYTQGVERLKDKLSDIYIYPIGIDRENKNKHFINLDLADFSYIFGNTRLYDELDKLPKPNVIIASPPCESWSIASAMAQGNACWKQEIGNKNLSKFTVRPYTDYLSDKVQFKYDKSFLNRINGELTAYNLYKIIERYSPTVYIIENPLSSRLWQYYEKIIGFDIPYENKVYYGHYGSPVKKPTKFKSNIDLGLNYTSYTHGGSFEYILNGYNNRSNIPSKLVDEILIKTVNYLKEK